MKIELTDESINNIMLHELTQSLEWARDDLAKYDRGVNANAHVYNEPENDKEELRKDIEAYERIVSYWKVLK